MRGWAGEQRHIRWDWYVETFSFTAALLLLLASGGIEINTSIHRHVQNLVWILFTLQTNCFGVLLRPGLDRGFKKRGPRCGSRPVCTRAWLQLSNLQHKSIAPKGGGGIWYFSLDFPCYLQSCSVWHTRKRKAALMRRWYWETLPSPRLKSWGYLIWGFRELAEKNKKTKLGYFFLIGGKNGFQLISANVSTKPRALVVQLSLTGYKNKVIQQLPVIESEKTRSENANANVPSD